MKDESSPKTAKSIRTQEEILDYLKDNGRSACSGIARLIGLSAPRTRSILSKMKEVEPLGERRNRTFAYNGYLGCLKNGTEYL